MKPGMRPNIEWWCFVPPEMNDQSYEKLLDLLNDAHQTFASVVGLEHGSCVDSRLDGNRAVLRFVAPKRFRPKLHRLDNRFMKITAQQRYEEKPARPERIVLPGVADRPPEPPTQAEILDPRFADWRELVQRAKALGIKANQKKEVLERLVAEKDAAIAKGKADDAG